MCAVVLAPAWVQAIRGLHVHLLNENLQAAAVGSIFSPIPVDTWPTTAGFWVSGPCPLWGEISSSHRWRKPPPSRHMLKRFNTIMANSHLCTASVWNDSFCVYANRAVNMAETVLLFKGNVPRQLLCRVIWCEIIERVFFSFSTVVGFLEFFPILASMKHQSLINKQCRAARNDSFHMLTVYLLSWSM